MPHTPDHLHDGADAARSGMPTGQRLKYNWDSNTKNSMPRAKTPDNAKRSASDMLDESKSRASYLTKTRIQHPGTNNLDGPLVRTTNPVGSINPAIRDDRETRNYRQESTPNMYSYGNSPSSEKWGGRQGDLIHRRIDPGDKELGTLNSRVEKTSATKRVADPDAKRYKMGKKKGQPKQGDGKKTISQDRYVPSVVRMQKGDTELDRARATAVGDESQVNTKLKHGVTPGVTPKRIGFRTQKRAEIAAEAMGKRRMEGRDVKTGRKPNFSTRYGSRVGETY